MGSRLITRSRKKKDITETKTRITTAPYWEAGVQDVNTWLDQSAKQRMTHKLPMKLLSPKACVKFGQWNVRTLFEAGKCAQVIKEMKRYGICIPGVSEMRWNSCGKLRIATGETVLYSGMDEGENHERGVGFILSKEAAQCLLEWEPVSDRIIRARFDSRWQQVTILQRYAPTNETAEVKDDFYDQLQMVLEQVPCRDVKIVMGDMNAKVGMDNTGREEVMGKHEEEELSVDDEWRQIEQGYVETCEQVLGRAKTNGKEWISKETWEIIEQRKEAKNTMNMARTRKQKRDANKRYQELNRGVKRRCRRDRRVYVELEAGRAEEAGNVRGGSFGSLQQDME